MSACSSQEQPRAATPERATTKPEQSPPVGTPRIFAPDGTTPSTHHMETDSEWEVAGSPAPSTVQEPTPVDWAIDPKLIEAQLKMLVTSMQIQPLDALKMMAQHPNAQVPTSILHRELNRLHNLVQSRPSPALPK